jgi:hypothetical protein
MLNELRKKKIFKSLKDISPGFREAEQKDLELGPGFSKKELDKDYFKEDVTVLGDPLGPTSTRELSEEEEREELKKKKKYE